MTLLVYDWMRDELVRRKNLVWHVWAGEPLARAPVYVYTDTLTVYTVQERYFDAGKQLEVALASAMVTWEHVPSADAIPAMFADVGCSCLASAFGAEYYWGHDPMQTPWVGKIITDLEAEVDDLPVPDPRRDGWLPEGLRRIRLFAEVGEGFIPTTLLDAASGINVAADLMGLTELLLALVEMPGAVRKLLDKIQQLYAATIKAGIEAAGGEENITTVDFPWMWFPEFSAPYHARIFARFGCGGLDNCGPNPCHEAYVADRYSPRAIDLASTYSYSDLPAFKRSLRKKAFVYLFFDSAEADPVDWYAAIMELMAPDVLVVPVVTVPLADGPEETCRAMMPIAEEYARRMDWGWETACPAKAGGVLTSFPAAGAAHTSPAAPPSPRRARDKWPASGKGAFPGCSLCDSTLRSVARRLRPL